MLAGRLAVEGGRKGRRAQAFEPRLRGTAARIVRFVSIAGSLATVLAAAPAHAEDTDGEAAKAVCQGAYANAQLHRQRGELLAARGDLRTCGSEGCPAIARGDCVQWLAEVEASLPTLVLEARADGSSLFDVTVKIDGEVVAARLDGRPIEVDPGLHGLTFESQGRPSLQQKVIVRAGEKSRLLVGDWGTTRPPLPQPAQRPIPLGVYVTAAVAVLGFADFGIAAALGNSVKSELEANNCAPFCSHADVQAMRARYLVADAGLAVGVAEVVTSIVLFATRPSVPQHPRARTVPEPPWGFFASASPAGGVIGLRTAF
jgi:hypothetical protein